MMTELKYYLYYLDTKLNLEPESIYTIGRDKDNIIQLPGLTTSRKHARILWEDMHFLIEDTKSTNGIFINGQKCNRHVLFDGDHITIGTFFLVYKEYDAKGLNVDNFDYTLTDTLIIEHQIADLLKDISDKNIQEKLINLKMHFNRFKSKLDRLANRDRLTRLYNRRYFDEEFRKEIERSARYRYSIALLMIDIDNFKKINDTYGHQKGDQVLSVVASIISESLRLNDLVARYGGEEIVVLIPQAESAKLLQIAEKIRIRVENETIERLGLMVTVSIGCAYSSADAGGDSLIKVADEALYEAKDSGKNKVVCH